MLYKNIMERNAPVFVKLKKIMAYKWKPSKSQAKAFAIKMQDPNERKAYEERKEARAEKRRAGSKFDYASAGGNYVPTEAQYNYACMLMRTHNELTPEQKEAVNEVIYGYTCGEKVHHDHIHIVNEHMRNKNL